MTKYQVGDIVTVKHGITETEASETRLFVSTLAEYTGQPLTIRSVREGRGPSRVAYCFKETSYWINEELLKPFDGMEEEPTLSGDVYTSFLTLLS